MSSTGREELHVVLLVTGDAGPGAAVRATALDLAAGGARVTVVGLAVDGRRSDVRLGPVRIIRVPPDLALHDAGAKRALRRRADGLPGLRPLDPSRENEYRRRLIARERDVPNRISTARVDLARQLLRGRRLAGRLGTRAGRVAWDAIDRARGEVGILAPWRTVLPEVNDYEFVLGPVVDALEPDVIHVVDAGALPVAARAVHRARQQGRAIRWIHDGRCQADPWPARESSRRSVAARANLESEFVGGADGVVDDGDRSLSTVYAAVTHGAVSVPRRPHVGRVEPLEEAFVRDRAGRVVLGIGPTNSAGQAWAWTSAAKRRFEGVETEVVALINGRYDYPSDVSVTAQTFAHDPTWGLNLREHAVENWTHALIEAGRPLFGRLGGEGPQSDIDALRRAGVEVGLVFHGSEVRSPREHARSHPFSPFSDPTDPYTARLQAVTDRNVALLDEFVGPVFVSTPDQLDYVPRASWLPVVIDLADWPLQERTRPVPLVVHAPSNPILKGTPVVEEVAGRLAAQGRIEYRQVSGMQPADAAALVRDADIVIDQLLLGLYGVLACEGLASGAVVLGHVGDPLRGRVPRAVPIIEVTPQTLESELGRVLDELDDLRQQAPERRRFVEALHDGCYAADVLGPFLGAPRKASNAWESCGHP